MGEPHAPAPPGRLLAVCAVDQPGGAEIGLLRLLAALSTGGWEVTLTTPGRGPLRNAARAAGHAWRALAVGGLERGAGARAMLSWPLVRHISRRADVIYLNGGVCGRLLPAIGRGDVRRVLHVHDIVDRVPPFWRSADVVLADSAAVADRLTGLDAHVVGCLVAAGQPADLAAAVLEVLAARETMGAAARDRARRFDASAYEARVERLIAPGSAATV